MQERPFRDFPSGVHGLAYVVGSERGEEEN